MMTFSLSDLLPPERVLLDLPTTDEKAAIRAVTALFRDDENVGDLDRLTTQVLDREALSSTALGSGVAFPHARTDEVRRIVIAAGRSRAGVPFQKGKERVNFLFVIATPPNQAPQYLAAVAKLARLLKSNSVREKLMQATGVEEFLAPLRAAG